MEYLYHFIWSSLRNWVWTRKILNWIEKLLSISRNLRRFQVESVRQYRLKLVIIFNFLFHCLIFIGKNCGIPDVADANGAFIVMENESIGKTIYGTIYNVSCQLGWEWSNSSFRDEILSITCTDTETWSILPAICKRILPFNSCFMNYIF